MVDFVAHKWCQFYFLIFNWMFSLIALATAELKLHYFYCDTKLPSNLSSKPNMSEFCTFSSMLVCNTCRLYCCILECNLCVIAAHECLPQGIRRLVQELFPPVNNLLNQLSSFEVWLWSNSKSAMTYSSLYDLRTERTDKIRGFE